MSVVKIINNIKFYFYSNEGLRPHIHVKLAEFEVQVWLDDLSIKQGDSKRVTGISRKTPRRITGFLE